MSARSPRTLVLVVQVADLLACPPLRVGGTADRSSFHRWYLSLTVRGLSGTAGTCGDVSVALAPWTVRVVRYRPLGGESCLGLGGAVLSKGDRRGQGGIADAEVTRGEGRTTSLTSRIVGHPEMIKSCDDLSDPCCDRRGTNWLVS